MTELILNFADACRALVPRLDRAEVAWRDGEQGDNWDRVAEPLFETLVIEPCVFQAVGEADAAKLRPARYGFLPTTNTNAWILTDNGGSVRMIDLASVARPFDHVRGEERDTLIPIADARFGFVYVSPDGVRRRIDKVDLRAV